MFEHNLFTRLEFNEVFLFLFQAVEGTNCDEIAATVKQDSTIRSDSPYGVLTCEHWMIESDTEVNILSV